MLKVKICNKTNRLCMPGNECDRCILSYPEAERNRDIFIRYFMTVKRKGVERFLEWLDSTDFYIAPCSTRYHLSVPGGLCKHSLNVMDNLIASGYASLFNRDTLIICALGHDVCKTDFYGVEMRNRKNEFGKWEQYPFYVVKDKFPYGHGEKSVLLLQQFFELCVEEVLAVRWHMGLTPGMDYGTACAFNEACKFTPLVPLLHMADFEATNITEIGL